jgi:hypothetical protein
MLYDYSRYLQGVYIVYARTATSFNEYTYENVIFMCECAKDLYGLNMQQSYQVEHIISMCFTFSRVLVKDSVRVYSSACAAFTYCNHEENVHPDMYVAIS